MEVASGVFLSSIRVPAGVSEGLSRDGSPLGVGNSRPNSSAIMLSSKSRMSRVGILGVVLKVSMSNNIGEVIGGVLFSSIAVPAGVSVSLSRNVSPLGVGNSNKDVSSSVVLGSVRHSPESLRSNSISNVS